MTPVDHAGYRLMHEGVIALSEIEATGLCIDVPYLDRTIEELGERRRQVADKLRETRVWNAWRKRFGTEAKLSSRAQLAEVLFKVLGHTPSEYTDAARTRPSTDESALEKIDLKFVKEYLKLMKLEKARGTYLMGIKREVDANGFLHPVNNLHTTTTFRSSVDSPSFQNMPIRNPEMGKLIRSCFISRWGEDGCIVENDFKGIEVGVAACYHKDPVMLEYVRDPSKDMHRDMAMQIYMLEQAQVQKDARHEAKNKFVFPQFYGNWWKACAKSLWEGMSLRNLTLKDGTLLRDHLRAKGITKLGNWDPDEHEGEPPKGTFERHVKDVESDFWGRRFKVYDAWKRRWYARYLEEGGFTTLTGFRIDGAMNRKQVINYCVQGSAFHCLLWTLIRVNRLLRKYALKSRVVGQIHDSMIGDVLVRELRDYLDIVREVTMEKLPKAYDWIIVPLVVECEIAPSIGSWFDKKEVVYDGATFKCSDNEFNSARALVRYLNEQHAKKTAA